ncbi:MAG: shikimate kinase [Terriglobia bacterium]
MNTGPIPIQRCVYLLGFMGCGKTTVGRLLAGRLGWRFIDLDQTLEQRQGRTINQIFAAQGEPYFRQIERRLLEEIVREAQERSTVVALGGGTFAQPANFELIRANGGITVWLDCPLEELRRRCRGMTHRPLFRDAPRFQQLFQQRLPYYRQADFRVDADRSDPNQVVEEILRCGVF